MIRRLRGIRWSILLLTCIFPLQGGIVSALANDNTQQQVYQLGINYYDVHVDCAASGSGSLPTLVGNDNIQQAYNFFVSQGGLSPVQAAGILGNLLQESGGKLNPTAGTLTAGVGYGIAQWTTADRQAALVAYAKSHGTDASDFATQLGFLWQELTTSYKNVLTTLKSANDVATATSDFTGPDNLAGQPVSPTDEVQRSGGYENPSQPVMKNRIGYAEQVIALYGNNSTNSGSSSASSTASSTDTSSCAASVDCTPTTNASTAGTGSTSSNATPTTVSAGGLSTVRQNVVCLAQHELSVWKSQPGYPTTAYAQTGYLKYSDGSPEEWCADFVSWIYKQAGDPFTGGSSGGWRIPAVVNIQALGVQNGAFHWHSQATEPNYVPKPGDIAIHIGPGVSHTNIFISSTSGVDTYIGGDQGNGPYPGGSVVSTEITNNYWADDIIGYVTPD